MTLCIRLFFHCGGDEEARQYLADICKTLSAFYPTSNELPKQYWKIPALYELYIQCGRADENAFQELIDFQPIGWTHGGDEYDRSSVWNWTDGHHFLDTKVAWAEIQLSAH